MPSSENLFVPDYIAERIRRKPPEGCSIIPGTTPVVSFGNAATAKVATLSINPSSNEFLGGEKLLTGDKQRLVTRELLGLGENDEFTDDHVVEILKWCNNYFQNSVYHWFQPLEEILNCIDFSYADGTACHLDLSQWATMPAWSKLSPKSRDQLIKEDSEFLRDQLEQENITTVVVNGRDAWVTLKKYELAKFKEVEKSYYGPRPTPITYFSGVGLGTRFLGWSAAPKSIRGSDEIKKEAVVQISEWLQRNY